MRGAWYIGLRRTLHTPGLSLVTAACIAVALFLPLATTLLARWYERALTARADATPIVAGAPGNRFDLTLAALYWRRSSSPTISMARYREIARDHVGADGVAVPLHVRFTARRVPIVATSTEYFAHRSLRVARGTLPLMLGDAVVGAAAARRLGVRPDDTLYSDQIDTFDIARPPALRMRVVGVLEASRDDATAPDDDAVFVDIKTAWILEGLAHGHADAATGIDQRLVLDRSPAGVSISEELIESNAVTPENAATFHLHAEETALPLTGVVIFPRDAKGRTLIGARLGVTRDVQGVAPAQVIAELLGVVARVRAILYVFFALLGASTLALLALVVTLSVKTRARESLTLHRIGCSRWFVLQVHAAEVLAIIGVGVALALVSTAAAAWLAPGIVRLLQGGVPGS